MKYHPLLEQQLDCFIQLRNKESERFLRQISLAYEEFENISQNLCSTERLNSIDIQLIQLQNEIDDNDDLENNIKILCRRGASLLKAASLGLWHIDQELEVSECECEYIVKANDFIADKTELITNYEDLNQKLLGSRSLWHEADINADSLTLDIPIIADQYTLGFLRAQISQPHSDTKTLNAWLGAILGDFARYIYLKYRRRLALDELEESEHRFKALAESTGAAIFAFRETIIYANKATEELIGLDQPTLKLLPISIILGQDFAKRFNSHTLSNKRNSIGVEIEFARPSGEIRWTFINVAQTHFAGQHTWLASAFDITERKRAEIQLRFQAFHDNLTSLPNRIHACQTIDSCLTKASRDRYYRFAAAIIEIQGLNELAEQLGFNSTDHYLIDIALKLKKFTQSTDHIAKVSHDSFVFIRENIANKDVMQQACTTLLTTLKSPLNIDGIQVSQPIKFGITYCDRLYQSGEEVLRHCSIAAQSQAYKKHSEIVFFNDGLLQKIEQQKAVAAKLRKSISRYELGIRLTAYKSTKQQSLEVFEALIHWKESHPCRLGEEHFQLLNRDPMLVKDIARWLVNTADDQESLSNNNQDKAIWVDLSSIPLRSTEDIFSLTPYRNTDSQSHLLILQVPLAYIEHATDAVNDESLSTFIQHMQQNRCALAVNLNELNLSQLEHLPDSGITFAKIHANHSQEHRSAKALLQMALKYCSMLGIQVFIDNDENESQLLTQANKVL